VREKEKLIVLVGPTAVGKTALSIRLAHRFQGEIISGDSMQIYKGMDIGTAKVTKEEMAGIPHHLIDIKEPDESFSVAEFQKLVRKKITEITERGRIPILVGGTGLYIQSVIYDYQFTDVPGDSSLRAELEQTAIEKGELYLHQQLKEVDPKSAESIHPHNVRRVIRALEIYYTTGKPMSEHQSEQLSQELYHTAIVGLTMERSKLYERINQRVDLMISQGLIEEVKELRKRGIRNCQSVQAIGYKEIYDYLDGKVTLDEAIEQLKKNSRRYAKRQFTWFRNKMNVQWFDVTNEHEREKKFQEISQFIAGKLHLK